MTKFDPELYLISLGRDRNGKDNQYLEAKYRLLWFYNENPGGAIVCTVVQVERDYAVVQAEIFDSDGKRLAQANGSAQDKGNTKWSGRALEKAETAAVARALAYCGYGTQYVGRDLDDGDDLSDSPAEPIPHKSNGKPYSGADKKIDTSATATAPVSQGELLDALKQAQGDLLDAPAGYQFTQDGKYILADLLTRITTTGVDGIQINKKTHFENAVNKLVYGGTLAPDATPDNVESALRAYYKMKGTD